MRLLTRARLQRRTPRAKRAADFEIAEIGGVRLASMRVQANAGHWRREQVMRSPSQACYRLLAAVGEERPLRRRLFSAQQTSAFQREIFVGNCPREASVQAWNEVTAPAPIRRDSGVADSFSAAAPGPLCWYTCESDVSIRIT